MTRQRKMQERRGWAFLTGGAIVKPLLQTFTRRDWRDGDRLPARGGYVVAANHISHLDPLTFAHFLWDHGRLPRFLAKAEVFDVPVAGRIVRGAGQIPVHRLSTDAAQAFDAAVEAVQEGKVVVVYPEGTITRDPDLWPMTGKTGAARIALSAGVPLIPVAQWGAQDVLWPYTKRPHLLPPRTVRVKVGDPVDLDDLRDRPITPALLHEATDRVMDAITALLEDLRGEQAPPERFDSRKQGVRQIGNPHAREGAATRRPTGRRHGRTGEER